MAHPNSKKIMTLCLVHDDRRLLLGLKKRGFGQGRWNGFGGKLLPGESVEDAARRETREEAGIEVGGLSRRGIIDFVFQDNPEELEVHIFSTQEFSGEPIESEEMRPVWFNFSELPFDRMWPDDRHWLPLFLAGKNFRGRFLFENTDRILDFTLNETDEDLS